MVTAYVVVMKCLFVVKPGTTCTTLINFQFSNVPIWHGNHLDEEKNYGKWSYPKLGKISLLPREKWKYVHLEKNGSSVEFYFWKSLGAMFTISGQKCIWLKYDTIRAKGHQQYQSKMTSKVSGKKDLVSGEKDLLYQGKWAFIVSGQMGIYCIRTKGPLHYQSKKCLHYHGKRVVTVL